MQLLDVTLRDGLQMEAAFIPTEKKLELFHLLSQCGWDRIEITSFVNPKWVPQFADSEAFCQKLFEGKKVATPLMAFVPNGKGVERLLAFPIAWVGAFVSVTEAFNKKNVNCSVDESLTTLKEVVELGHRNKRKVRVYISTVFGCPYQGKVSTEEAVKVVEKVVALGPDEVALSDTIGVAVPSQIKKVLAATKKILPVEKTTLHLHNTYGLALSNIFKALECGIESFDGSTGGVGGCPYAKGATGNASLDDIAYALSREGLVKFNSAAVQKVLNYLRAEIKVKTHSHVGEVLEKGGTLYGAQ